MLINYFVLNMRKAEIIAIQTTKQWKYSGNIRQIIRSKTFAFKKFGVLNF